MNTETIGPFLVESVLASSRWAVLYTCKGPDGAKCAVKVFELGDLSVKKTAENVAVWRRRFEQERQLLRDFSHPHLINLNDNGEDAEGRPYFSMPFMEANLIGEIGGDIGENVPLEVLGPRRRPRPVPLRRAIAVLRQILKAASFLHEHGVIHRDLKPSNILMTRRSNGRVRIGDLGMACVGENSLDVPGEILGTTGYRAPEINDGMPVKPTADIYSIGAIAQRLMTGGPVRKDARPVEEINPDIPVDLARIVNRALSKVPTQRQANASEMAQEIEAFLDSNRL